MQIIYKRLGLMFGHDINQVGLFADKYLLYWNLLISSRCIFFTMLFTCICTDFYFPTRLSLQLIMVKLEFCIFLKLLSTSLQIIIREQNPLAQF